MTPIVTLSILLVIATAALAKGLWLWDWRLMVVSAVCSSVFVVIFVVAHMKKPRPG